MIFSGAVLDCFRICSDSFRKQCSTVADKSGMLLETFRKSHRFFPENPSNKKTELFQIVSWFVPEMYRIVSRKIPEMFRTCFGSVTFPNMFQKTTGLCWTCSRFVFGKLLDMFWTCPETFRKSPKSKVNMYRKYMIRHLVLGCPVCSWMFFTLSWNSLIISTYFSF